MKPFTFLLILLLLCGCTETVTKSGLAEKSAEHAGFSFPDQTFYIGSEGGFDYFVIRRGLGGSTHRYRVLESESAATNRFKLTKDEALWRDYHTTDVVVTNGRILNIELAPFTIRFIKMVPKKGMMAPKVEIVNQTGKDMDRIELAYKCFDSSGREIAGELDKWGITGAEPPAEALFVAKSTNEAVIGFNASYIPDGTVRVSAVPLWARFRDGTEWRGK